MFFIYLMTNKFQKKFSDLSCDFKNKTTTQIKIETVCIWNTSTLEKFLYATLFTIYRTVS